MKIRQARKLWKKYIITGPVQPLVGSWLKALARLDKRRSRANWGGCAK